MPVTVHGGTDLWRRAVAESLGDRAQEPDVSVILLPAPGFDALDAIRGERRRGREVVVVSNYANGLQAAVALSAGASGYLSARVPTATIGEAARTGSLLLTPLSAPAVLAILDLRSEAPDEAWHRARAAASLVARGYDMDAAAWAVGLDTDLMVRRLRDALGLLRGRPW